MVRPAKLLLWFAIAALAAAASGASSSDRADESRIRVALTLLERSPTGREIVRRARLKWKIHGSSALLSFLRWGEASRTDAVLTRFYLPETGEERRERRVTVYLRRGQGLGELALDIAHELTHASTQPGWDPYDPELTPARYIRAAIEGAGGEVDALLVECQVGRELESRYGIRDTRCARYGDLKSVAVQRETIKRDFYRVGPFKRELIRRLGKEASGFPLLSEDPAELFSSTGHAPYPVALYGEYEEITQAACKNTRERLEVNRSPAGASGTGKTEPRTLLARRCR